MWIKICGIRDVPTARQVAGLGVDAIGLNFYQCSPRAVDRATAAEIVRSLPENVEPVGVFVNCSASEIDACCRECGIATVQLHGDEPPQLLGELRTQNPGLKVIRVIRFNSSQEFDSFAEELDRHRPPEFTPDAYLVDSRVDGAYGGTGETVCWQRLAECWGDDCRLPPLILAGGLTAENVAQAIRSVNPWGVDVASGVESSPGCKDLGLVTRFVESASSAPSVPGGPRQT
jgi:phosphoribosylanthranilate isomerase